MVHNIRDDGSRKAIIPIPTKEFRMTSLARRTRAKKLAATVGKSGPASAAGTAAEAPKTGKAATEYNNLLASLHNDLREISDIQSIEARNPVKVKKMATYIDWVEGAIAAGQEQDGKPGTAVQDEIVVTMLIWAIDIAGEIGGYDLALEIAEHCLNHGLALPERYNRTLGCFVAEQIAEQALAQGGDVDLAVLVNADKLTERADMPDQARAKLMKALGRSYFAAAENFDAESDNAVAGGKPALATAALNHFKRALALDVKCGVKTNVRVTERLLKDLGNPEDQSTE